MRSAIQMPRLLALPDSPHRRLVETLHSYYRQAGYPTLQAIQDWIDEQEGMTASKETVRRTLVGISVPLRWDIAETIFLALCTLARRHPNEHCDQHAISTLREAYYRQWQAVVTPGHQV